MVWTEPALNAIMHAYDYPHALNPAAAAKAAQELLAAGDSLADFPHCGRPVLGTRMRELIASFPYIIRYRIDGDIVVVLRVRHASRRPTRW